LTHSKPNLRVLEVGAGTGASTRTILKDLAPSDERILYSKYTFTDISAGLLFAAKENFKTFPNMEYATLDISQDPAEQGFEDRLRPDPRHERHPCNEISSGQSGKHSEGEFFCAFSLVSSHRSPQDF
jgi:SAM-dependent methyltransferase